MQITVLHDMAIPRLQECCRQVEAEVVSEIRNEIHQSWEQPFSEALYKPILHFCHIVILASKFSPRLA